MTNENSDSKDALLALVGMARDEVDGLLAESAEAHGDALRASCAGHLDNLVWATNEAGLDNHYLIVQALQTHVADDSQPFGAEQVAGLAGWLAEFEQAMETPDDLEILAALLHPLPEDIQQNLSLALLENFEAALASEDENCLAAGDTEMASELESSDIPVTADVVLEPVVVETEASVDSAVNEVDWELEESANEIVVTNSVLDAIEIDTDGMLGMLAHELREVFNDLERHASALGLVENPASTASSAEAYREIVRRVGSVADELDLQGLIYICGFIADNLDRIATLDVAERAPGVELLREWPIVVIEHLVDPEDDARCIAVIDYLERESWPQPLPYRDQRDLIEGLARSVEISGDFEVEKRELEATDEHVSLQLSGDTSPELIEAFFAETPGLAENFSQLVSAIANGQNIQQNVEAAQRIAHTLKGSGNLIGVKGLANLAHHIEDIFDFIARKRIAPPPPLAAVMQEAADTMEAMVEFLQDLAPPPEDARRVLQQVLDWANRIDSGKMRGDDYTDEQGRSTQAAGEAVLPEMPVTGEGVERRGEQNVTPTVAAEVVRVPLKLLDDIFRIVSETAIATGQIKERLNRLEGDDKLIRKNDNSMQQHRYELENLVSIRAMAARHRGSTMEQGDDFDPLEMDQYDEFYGATHAFIESVSDSREILRGFSGEVYELNALFLEHQQLNKELQQKIMATRMVPVSTIASRLQRTVRQVCRSTGKQAELVIAGQELLLDGDVLGKLADPLMHMLRNAIDHGIEDGDKRSQTGKNPTGRIGLGFRQQGNSVVVSCADDGGGLDYQKIRWIAIERGLLAEAETATNQTLARIILRSGFSTSDKITQVSGRGVGMDVVHNTIQSLNGSMDIEESPDGEGTLITLRIPITLLTSHCLLAGVGQGNLYAIPTISLTQILSPGTGRINRVDDKMTFQLEQDIYPACTLNSLIGIGEAGDDKIEKASVLLVQSTDGTTAVLVERVVTSYDLVVKNMGAYVKSISGIAGVSMLGNGEVVPVLDLGAMLQTYAGAGARTPVVDSALPSVVDKPRALVVDDSLSVRNALSQLLRDSGYEVLLARDGLEAINVIEAEQPDIVLTDLEMPRMNGLELVSYVRTSSRRKDLPVVMITSRNMSKHRNQAEQSGVNRFIGKPFSDDEVLDTIDSLLTTPA